LCNKNTLAAEFETRRVGRVAHVAKQPGIAAGGAGIGHDPLAVPLDRCLCLPIEKHLRPSRAGCR
jgi:hypothetical protein